MADFGAMTALGDLQHHWGSAYMISHLEPDIWLAQRRDDYATLRAEGPEQLLYLIRQDYARKPVPRRQRPQRENPALSGPGAY
jgi:hypothetical protein